MATVNTLLKQLESGTPRAQYLAREQLVLYAAVDVERPLTNLLNSTTDSNLKIHILTILAHKKVTQPSTVDVLMRQLTSKERRLRLQAATTLLQASPKLRRVLPQLRAIHTREPDTQVRASLQKLLDRYPTR